MAGFIVRDGNQGSRPGQNAFNILSQILMNKIAYNQQREMLAEETKIENQRTGVTIGQTAFKEGRDVKELQPGEQVPQGYQRNPYRPSQAIGPIRPDTTEIVDVAGREYMRTIEPTGEESMEALSTKEADTIQMVDKADGKAYEYEVINTPDGRKEIGKRLGLAVPKKGMTVQNFLPGQQQPDPYANELLTYDARKTAETLQKIDQNASMAVKMNYNIDRVAQAIARGAKTGPFQESLLNVKNVLIGMGWADQEFIDKASEQEIIRKFSNEAALMMRNPEGGLGLTGNTSNKDLAFLKASVFGLARSTQGNVKILQSLRKFNDMSIAMNKEKNRLMSEAQKGNIQYSEVKDGLMDFMDNYEFFTPKERAQIENVFKQGARSFLNTKDIRKKISSRGIPKKAINILMKNPTPEAIRYFENTFEIDLGFMREQ